jgi:hypothetical protein
MKTNTTTADGGLGKAIEQAKQDSLSSLPTAVYQVRCTSGTRFIVTSTPLGCGMLVGCYMNGVNDGRYVTLFR